MTVQALTDRMTTRDHAERGALDQTTVAKTATYYANKHPHESITKLYERAAYDAWDLDGRVEDRGERWGEHLLHGSEKIHLQLQLKHKFSDTPEDVIKHIATYLPPERSGVGLRTAIRQSITQLLRDPKLESSRRLLREMGLPTTTSEYSRKDLSHFINAFYSVKSKEVVTALFYTASATSSTVELEKHLQSIHAQHILSWFLRIPQESKLEILGEADPSTMEPYELASFVESRLAPDGEIGLESTLNFRSDNSAELTSEVLPENHIALAGNTEEGITILGQRYPAYYKRARLFYIPSCLLENKGLTEVKIENTKLRELPEKLFELLRLETLIVDTSLIEKIPEPIVRLNNLTRLMIANAPLKEIPESITELTQLQYLEFPETHISKLPEVIGNLTNLLSLRIKKTGVSELPESLPRCWQLLLVDISDTKIREIPETIKEIPGIRFIYAKRCEITEIPDWIVDCPNITNMQLSGNSIASLPENSKFPTLMTLNLSENPLSEVPPTLFDSEKLECLNLDSCRLETFPDELARLPRARSFTRVKVYLRSNRIKELPDIFDPLRSLTIVDLSDNCIEKIPEFLTSSFLRKGLRKVTGPNRSSFPWQFDFKGNPLRDITESERACFHIE